MSSLKQEAKIIFKPYLLFIKSYKVEHKYHHQTKEGTKQPSSASQQTTPAVLLEQICASPALSTPTAT